MDELQLPDGFRQLENQVAGHTFQSTNTEVLGLLQDPKSGCVLKPLGKPDCGARELKFYEALLATNDNTVLGQAKMFVPRFYHKLDLVINKKEYTFLKLEDLTYDMKKPCIMDVKVGKRTWDPLATPEKRAVEEQKYMHCKRELGLCVPGFQMYVASPTFQNDYKLLRYDKEYGKPLSANGFRETLATFLNISMLNPSPLIAEVLRQLYVIRDWFKRQRVMHFYASSLLIVYDFVQLEKYLEYLIHLQFKGAKSVPLISTSKDGSGESGVTIIGSGLNKPEYNVPASQWVKVKMIDFAHVFPAESNALDYNYLFGLENLIIIVEGLLPHRR